ncbi:DUF2232 domain-containing protein [Candidatus Bealeia paramacronuclearis]|uniref:DUF2232 domain-containing protein n=2 Tax=Candidatus Bealeia paramacronuclearis TaxID=1921001 RepID=A0ABZ2C545_9PROT|nr:hypothetical protein [Candidatus Bealeia paramacronuclearis]
MAFRQYPLPLSILGGVLSAAPYFLLATPSLGGMLLTYFSTLPLFAVGLGLGFSSALIAGAAGIVLSLIFSMMSGSFGLAIPYAIFNVIPTILILFKALQYRTDESGEPHYTPSVNLMNFLTSMALGIAGVSFLLIQFSLAQSGENLSALIQAAMGPQPAETILILTALIKVLPGIVAMSWAMMALMNAILAQGLLKAFGKNLRPSPDVCDVYPLPIFYYILAALGVMTLLPLGVFSDASSNLIIPALLPFLLTGIGTVHAIARKFSYASWILFGFYTVALLLSWPFFFLVPLGLIEPWVKLRNRIA